MAKRKLKKWNQLSNVEKKEVRKTWRSWRRKKPMGDDENAWLKWLSAEPMRPPQGKKRNEQQPRKTAKQPWEY